MMRTHTNTIRLTKYSVAGLLAILVAAVIACGGNAIPEIATDPGRPALPSEEERLAEVAASRSGGPGAIYVGDLSQLVGPAPGENLGGIDGVVPLDSLQRHIWAYEHPYYRDLLDKANFTIPTELISTGERFVIQHACISKTFETCKLIESFWAPNLSERTKGQLTLEVTDVAALGVDGPDTLSLVAEGTLGMAAIFNGFLARTIPEMGVVLQGPTFPSHEIAFKSKTSLFPELDHILADASGGVVILNRNWLAGSDLYTFSNKKLETLDDFKGLTNRTIAPQWITGMGGEGVFLPLPEVYSALERGVLDAATSAANSGYGFRWHDVVKYGNGPRVSLFGYNNVINAAFWNKLPPDLQQIFLEEGAKTELEQLRLMAIRNEVGVERLVGEGLEIVEFSDEIRARSREVLKELLESWVDQVGGDEAPIIQTWNDHVGAWLGLRVEPNGSVIEVPISKR